jgi:hypothetical protein
MPAARPTLRQARTRLALIHKARPIVHAPSWVWPPVPHPDPGSRDCRGSRARISLWAAALASSLAGRGCPLRCRL